MRPLLIRALAVALSIGLYLALAILGAGGVDAYFANPARAGVQYGGGRPLGAFEHPAARRADEHAEERLLSSEFGAACDSYRARTARLIPSVY